jgi:hypothetical protein
MNKEFLEFRKKGGGGPMQSKYEAPELTLIGQAEEIVMGTSWGGDDVPNQFGMDFEFEQDR